jgi:hypothetical protein
MKAGTSLRPASQPILLMKRQRVLQLKVSPSLANRCNAQRPLASQAVQPVAMRGIDSSFVPRERGTQELQGVSRQVEIQMYLNLETWKEIGGGWETAET